MASLKTWFLASRPFSFTAAVVPVVVGTLLAAEDHFSWWKALLALLGSVFFLAGTNFVNDYYDHVKGADGPDSLGMAGFIQRGILSPKSVLIAGVLCFAAGSGIGLVLCAVTTLAAALDRGRERPGGLPLYRRAGAPRLHRAGRS